jgi:hypothetical protein
MVFSFKDGVSTQRREELAYVSWRDCIHTLGMIPMTEEVRAAISRDEERDGIHWFHSHPPL